MAALAAGPAPGENGAAPDTKAALIATWSQAGWMIAQTTQTSVCADGTVVVAITAPTRSDPTKTGTDVVPMNPSNEPALGSPKVCNAGERPALSR